MCAGVFAVQISSHFLGGLVMLKLAVIVLGFILTSPAQGILIQDSLEGGVFIGLGWTFGPSTDVGNVSLVSGVVYGGKSYTPTDSDYMMKVTAGNPATAGPDGRQTYVTKTLGTVPFGSTLSFDWSWIGLDYAPFNDMSILLVGSNGVMNPSPLASIGLYGDRTGTGWNHWSQTFSGTEGFEIITIGFDVRNSRDRAFPSYLLVDNIRLEKAVPEPSTVMLIFSAVGFLLARRKCKVC